MREADRKRKNKIKNPAKAQEENCTLPDSASTRVCLQIAFRQMCVTICGRFDPNEGGVVGYVDRMRAKYTAKWGVHLAGMNYQTRSRVCLKIRYFHEQGGGAVLTKALDSA